MTLRTMSFDHGPCLGLYRVSHGNYVLVLNVLSLCGHTGCNAYKLWQANYSLCTVGHLEFQGILGQDVRPAGIRKGARVYGDTSGTTVATQYMSRLVCQNPAGSASKVSSCAKADES